MDAALFAARGVTGAKNIFEGPQGFYHVYHQGKYSRDLCLRDLGKQFLNADVIMKRYPCVGYSNDVIEACLQAIGPRRLTGRDVKDMIMQVSETGFHMAGAQPWSPPVSVVGAQFSIPFAAATTVLKRRFKIEDLEEFNNPDVCELAGRSRVETNTELQTGSLAQYQRSPVVMDITLATGERLNGRSFTTAATHSSFENTATKFRECVRYSVSPVASSRTERVIDLCRHLEEVQDVRELVRLLA